MLVCVEAHDFLALIAAISNGFTGGTCLQFYFVDFCKPQEAQTSATSPSPSPLIIISVSTFTAIKQSGARDNKVSRLRWLVLVLASFFRTNPTFCCTKQGMYFFFFIKSVIV
jgi:hypothetical protein